jgi:hypothetical protein
VVYEVTGPDGRWIIKDRSSHSGPFRWIAGWLLGRERRVLETLRGIPGVPDPVVIDRDAFATRPLGGEPMRAGHTPGGVRAVADRLLELIDELARRGVHHLDLAHKQNIILDSHGNVSLVDFGSAVALGPWQRRLLGRLLTDVDRRAALKYVARWAPQTLTRDEARLILKGTRLRRWWFLSRHAPPAGEMEAVRARWTELRKVQPPRTEPTDPPPPSGAPKP